MGIDFNKTARTGILSYKQKELRLNNYKALCEGEIFNFTAESDEAALLKVYAYLTERNYDFRREPRDRRYSHYNLRSLIDLIRRADRQNGTVEYVANLSTRRYVYKK